jgi:hypothetical protein
MKLIFSFLWHLGFLCLIIWVLCDNINYFGWLMYMRKALQDKSAAPQTKKMQWHAKSGTWIKCCLL